MKWYFVTLIVLTYCENNFFWFNLNFFGVLRGQKGESRKCFAYSRLNVFEIHFWPSQYPRKIQITLEKNIQTVKSLDNYCNKFFFLTFLDNSRQTKWKIIVPTGKNGKIIFLSSFSFRKQ